MSFGAALEQAAKEAVCSWLANGGNAAVATWIVNGSRTPWTAVAGGVAALGLLAVNYGCNYDPNKTTGTSDFANGPCPGWDAYLLKQPGYPSYGNWYSVFYAAEWQWVGWTTEGRPEFRNKQTGQLFQASDYSKAGGAEVGYGTGSTKVACTAPAETPAAPWQPHTYTDPTTNCTYVVENEGMVMNDDGTVQPILKVSPGAQGFAGGGIIGGCNFNPVVYVPPGGGGGGGGVIPWTPGPDGPGGKPWWFDFAMGVAGRLVGSAIEGLIRKLFEQKVPGIVYRVVSVCETDAQGEPISQSREVVIPEAPVFDALLYRIDAMDDLMQGLKDFKQPVCPTTRPRPQGELVTARFRSVDPSPASARKLRKELRYRDNAGRPEADHIAHWLPFEWSAGPAIVTSKGAAWGIVEVWAADPAEGRRVIEHAAAIAGVDLTGSGHAWVDSAPRSARYGQTGLMRVEHTHDGRPCISKRVGPSGTPSWERDP